MFVQDDTKLIDIVNYNYHVLPVFNRFGIFAGFGDNTVEQICEQKNIDNSLFINVVNAFLDHDYLLTDSHDRFGVSDIIDYLRKAHQDYLRQLGHIEKLLADVLSTCCRSKQNEVGLISDFFLSYKKDLTNHIGFEDEHFFPYCLMVEKKYNSNDKNIKASVDIDYYRNEHMNIENKIVDLKSILVKYLPTDTPSPGLNALIFEIYDFESDLFSHQSIEDRLLLPKIEQIVDKLN